MRRLLDDQKKGIKYKEKFHSMDIEIKELDESI